MPTTNRPNKVKEFFADMNIFVNKTSHSTYGLRFWGARAYMDPSLSREEKVNFLQANSKVGLINVPEGRAQEQVKAFNRENISRLRLLNPFKPLYIGLQYLKSRMAAGIDKAAGSKPTAGDSEPGAKAAKIGIQILLAPIELPILAATKITDVVLDGIGAIRRKIMGSKKANTVEMTEQKVEIAAEPAKETIQEKAKPVMELEMEAPMVAVPITSTTYMTQQMATRKLPLSTTILAEVMQLKSSEPAQQMTKAAAEPQVAVPQKPNFALSKLRAIGVTPSFEENILKPHEASKTSLKM